MSPTHLSICVYCGSRHGAQPAYTLAARQLGTAIGSRGWQLVYGGGGGGGGVMGFLSGLLDFVSGNPEGQRFSVTPKGGAELVVKMKQEGDSEEIVFQGQLTGFFPSFDTHLPVTVHIRGMNKMHKLTRERRTRTFVNQTEQQIVSKIIQDNGLTPDFGREPPTLFHEHLHQPNQTDLKFLHQRTTRTYRECYVEKDTFYFRKRQKDDGPVAELTYTTEGVDGAEGNTDPDYFRNVVWDGVWPVPEAYRRPL
jgi:hypothetical protein